MTVNYTDATQIKQVTANVKSVEVKSIAVLAADTTVTTNKLILPANATLLGIQVVVPTGTATATLDIGLVGTGQATFVSAQALDTAGQFWSPLLVAGNLSSTFPPRTNYTISTTVGTAAVTSTVYVNVYYVR